MRWTRLTPVAAGTALVILGLGGLVWSDAASLGDVATVVQTVGVLVGIALAVATLRGDRRDKQVDRVLDLHREWMSGDIHSSRARLHEHLRWADGSGHLKVLPVAELQLAGISDQYGAGISSSPLLDSGVILRFFERANAALSAGAVYEPLFYELVARHAAWWNQALGTAPSYVPRLALQELVAWADGYRAAAGAPKQLLWDGHFEDVFRTVDVQTSGSTS